MLLFVCRMTRAELLLTRPWRGAWPRDTKFWMLFWQNTRTVPTLPTIKETCLWIQHSPHNRWKNVIFSYSNIYFIWFSERQSRSLLIICVLIVRLDVTFSLTKKSLNICYNLQSYYYYCLCHKCRNPGCGDHVCNTAAHWPTCLHSPHCGQWWSRSHSTVLR